MHDLQKAYVNGAAMSYRDVASKLEALIDSAPSETSAVLNCLKPFVEVIKFLFFM